VNHRSRGELATSLLGIALSGQLRESKAIFLAAPSILIEKKDVEETMLQYSLFGAEEWAFQL
jgi:hypothetical protein